MQFRQFFTALAAASATLMLASTAIATPVEYGFKDGGAYGVRHYLPKHAPNKYFFKAQYSLGDQLTLTLDEEAREARVTGSFSGDLIHGGNKKKIGTATSELDLLFTGLDIRPTRIGSARNPLLAVGVKGRSTSSGTLTTNYDFLSSDASDGSQTIDVFGGFLGANHPADGYRDLNAATNFILRDFDTQNNSLAGRFDIWVKSASGERIMIQPGRAFAVHGDIHGFLERPTTPTEIPEPATMLLLGSGVLGAGIRRRKRKAV